MNVPSGSSPEAFKAYYDYLYSNYYLAPNGGVTWEWLSLQNNLRLILVYLGWLVVTALGLWLLTRWQGRTRWRNDLYPQEEYNGYLQEHVGPVGVMKWVWVGIFLWTLFLTVQQILQGQVY